MDLKYILKVYIVVFIIISLILFIKSVALDLNAPDAPKKLMQVVTVEGLSTNCDKSIVLNPRDAFCESYRGSSGALDDACRKLTNNNCKATSCCTLTDDNKCVAGGAGGPTFTPLDK